MQIKHGSQKMIVREIRGRLRKRNGKWTTVRLWSSLLDATRYPGRELLELYGRRWEHEITYKELKRELRDSVLLNAHTVETARQEIVSCANWLQRWHRSLCWKSLSPKTLHMVRALWYVLALGDGILLAWQIRALMRRLLRYVAAQNSEKRRDRSCPRAVRQPVSSWARLLENSQDKGPFHYVIDKIIQ